MTILKERALFKRPTPVVAAYSVLFWDILITIPSYVFTTSNTTYIGRITDYCGFREVVKLMHVSLHFLINILQVSLVWKSKWSVGKGLFLFTRYPAIVQAIIWLICWLIFFHPIRDILTC